MLNSQKNSVAISVIIPNYNHATYLKERIDSVLNQTFQDFELILLDDCSSDHSVEILRNYENHPKVKSLLINSKNSGSVFKQWMKGINLASGKFIWIAESDDYADKYFLENTYEVILDNDKISLVYSDSFLINEELSSKSLVSKTRNDFFNNNRWSANYINNGDDEIINYFLYRNIIKNASSVLFKKEALQQVNLQKLTTYKNAGDLFFYCSILKGNNIAYVARPYNYCRYHANNTTKKNSKNKLIFEERLRIYFEIINSYELYCKTDLIRVFRWQMKRNVLNLKNCSDNLILAVDFLSMFYKKGIISSMQYYLLKILVVSYLKGFVQLKLPILKLV